MEHEDGEKKLEEALPESPDQPGSPHGSVTLEEVRESCVLYCSEGEGSTDSEAVGAALECDFSASSGWGRESSRHVSFCMNVSRSGVAPQRGLDIAWAASLCSIFLLNVGSLQLDRPGLPFKCCLFIVWCYTSDVRAIQSQGTIPSVAQASSVEAVPERCSLCPLPINCFVFRTRRTGRRPTRGPQGRNRTWRRGTGSNRESARTC